MFAHAPFVIATSCDATSLPEGGKQRTPSPHVQQIKCCFQNGSSKAPTPTTEHHSPRTRRGELCSPVQAVSANATSWAIQTMRIKKAPSGRGLRDSGGGARVYFKRVLTLCLRMLPSSSQQVAMPPPSRREANNVPPHRLMQQIKSHITKTGGSKQPPV